MEEFDSNSLVPDRSGGTETERTTQFEFVDGGIKHVHVRSLFRWFSERQRGVFDAFDAFLPHMGVAQNPGVLRKHSWPYCALVMDKKLQDLGLVQVMHLLLVAMPLLLLVVSCYKQ